MVEKNDPKEMKKQIEQLLHMIAFDARIIVDENDDISEQDIRDFIAEKGNKELNAVFSASNEKFMAMAFMELMKCALRDPNGDMT